MRDEKKVIAVVPARGGDPEVPYLNIKKLGAIPLIAHTLEEAKQSKYIDRILVSTDDDHVERVAREYSAEVVRRPDELTGDVSEIRDVIRHAVETVERGEPVGEKERFDIVVTLQATSPFRTAKQIDAAIDELVENDLDAVISLKEVRTLTWHRPGGKLEPLFERAGRRDELEPLYQEDGAIRVVRREVFDGSERLGERVGHVLMDKMSALTVHDIYDFWLAEKLVHLPRVVFCVDGDREMGMGHVFRSLAVARELTKIVPRADVCFLMRAEHPEGVQQIAREGYAIRVVPGSDDGTALDVIRDYSPNIIVNDRPFLREDYLHALAGLGAATINLVDSLDDIENPSELASIIVATMQEGDAELDDYHAGPAFAILRDSFRNKAGERPAVSDPGRKVILSFGGSDPQNLTMKALTALDSVPGISITTVLGPAYAYRRDLEALLPSLTHRPDILRNVEHMADILYEADLVLCSGGMTVFEIAALGRPGIVLCQNIKELERMEAFAKYGTILHLGLGTEVGEETIREKAQELLKDRERRQRMSDAGARLVDAQGVSRVYEVLKKAGNKGPANGGRWL